MQQDDLAPEGVESKINQWLGKQGKIAATTLLSVMLLATGVAVYTGYQRKLMAKDFIKAHQLAHTLNEKNSPKALDELQALMKKHRALDSCYRSNVVHASLKSSWTDPDLAVPKAPKYLNITSSEQDDFFRSFSKTSFVIAEHNYERALDETQELQLALENSKESLPLLELFLQLRTISLYHQLGESNQAKLAWSTLMKKQEKMPAAFAAFAAHLKEGSMDITTFPVYL